MSPRALTGDHDLRSSSRGTSAHVAQLSALGGGAPGNPTTIASGVPDPVDPTLVADMVAGDLELGAVPWVG